MSSRKADPVAAPAARPNAHDHTRAMGVTSCAECHNTNAGIHVASTATKEHKVGPSFNCYECHRGGGRSKITDTSCGSCHGVIVF